MANTGGLGGGTDFAEDVASGPGALGAAAEIAAVADIAGEATLDDAVALDAAAGAVSGGRVSVASP